MEEFSTRLRLLRQSKDMSVRELADKLDVSPSIINAYEMGKRNAPLVRLEQLADFFNVDMDYLRGKTDDKKKQVVDTSGNVFDVSKQAPILGRIACGCPILAEQNIECYSTVPINIKCDFILRCEGDSMIGDHINNGDLVYIKQQPIVPNGSIAAVLIDGEEATLKHILFNEESVILRGSNDAFCDMVFEGEDIAKIQILGRAVGFTTRI